MRTNRPPFPKGQRLASFEANGFKCAMCGTREAKEYDHIVPWSICRSHAIHNLIPACIKCNKYKSDTVFVVGLDKALKNIGLALEAKTKEILARQKDLVIANGEEIEVIATYGWTIKDTVSLIRSFLRYGKNCLVAIQKRMDRTSKQLISKLASIKLSDGETLYRYGLRTG